MSSKKSTTPIPNQKKIEKNLKTLLDSEIQY